MNLQQRLRPLGIWCIGLSMWLTATLGNLAWAVEIQMRPDANTGFTHLIIKSGQSEVHFIPEAGCNVFVWRYQNKDLLKTPTDVKKLPGFAYGVPVLYPTPNRVRNAQFQFDGKTFTFPANERTHFLHGLVHNVAWSFDRIDSEAEDVTVHCSLPFSPGQPWFDQFPLQHTLRLAITVKANTIRWTYTVDNSEGKAAVPFGFGLHPWFNYLGERSQTYLTIPATHIMESTELLPTGILLPLADTKFDARQPLALTDWVVDDVYYGLQPEQPVQIEFRDVKWAIQLRASTDFTHLVVYTPAKRESFCVEHQTCSTDAHNLYQKGFQQESHLQIVPPGKMATGFVEYSIIDLAQAANPKTDTANSSAPSPEKPAKNGATQTP